MKFYNKILALVLATNLIGAILCASDQDFEKSSSNATSIIEKADKEITKALSKKKRAKALKKLKSAISPESEAKITNQIVSSNISDAQKVALLELLIQAKSELDSIPADIIAE